MKICLQELLKFAQSGHTGRGQINVSRMSSTLITHRRLNFHFARSFQNAVALVKVVIDYFFIFE